MGQRYWWLVALLLAVSVVGCARQRESGTESGASVMTPEPDAAAASGEADAGASSAAPTQPQPEVSVETVPGGPILGMSFWKREVLPFEPILLRIELANPTVETLRVVPTYPGCESFSPLSIGVCREDGTPEDGAKLPDGSVFPWQGYYGDGYPWSATPRAPLPPRLPIDVAPGETRFMWLDLLRHFTFDEPGRYHVVFGYESDPAMLTGDDPRAQLETVLRIPRVQVDAGWITITEPNGAERKAADLIRDYRHQAGLALSAWVTARCPTDAVIAAAPGSDYAPYAEYAAAYGAAAYTSEPNGEPAERFLVKHPDFPLGYQLEVVLARARYFRPADSLDLVEMDLVREDLRDDMAPERRAELEARVQELTPAFEAARETMLTAARMSGDYELYQQAETMAWRTERWRQVEARQRAQPGTESDASPQPTKSGR